MPKWATPGSEFSDKTYAIADGEFIKIGRAWNVERRLGELQCGSARPLFIVSVHPLNIESKAHKLLRQARVPTGMGEWFRDTAMLRQVLGTLGFIAYESPLEAVAAVEEHW